MNMATNKRRLNITLTPEMEEFISILAKRDKVPEATKVSQILEKALEEMEDQILLEIAEERDVKGTKWISHEDFWKEIKEKI
jgi:predicted DNA-binding protein